MIVRAPTTNDAVECAPVSCGDSNNLMAAGPLASSPTVEVGSWRFELSHSLRAIRTLAAVTSTVVFSFSSVGFLMGSSNAIAATVPTCSSRVLSLSPGFSQVGAGNVGTPIVITNNGSATCTLVGYPIVIAHTEAVSPHPVTFVHWPLSEVYIATPVRIIVLAPQRTASFGISYVDGRDQQYGQGRDCLMRSITVRLPQVAPARNIIVPFRKGSDGFGGPINSCFTGFQFGLTPIVKGSTPPGP